ncbi:pilus assembly PilX N-terminal domain-containing protein [Psychrobacillus sp. NEAU-3TGS]|uniref:pilus assembly PilX N-terminal domain-containing protein n=1 Tax=Psychrobacillus sp. NEAU-3TGS TaxID=2995412 RepID=UPI00249608BF|nr:pilus assembly PilX N-terminal domain-containing protein [Psychrobacillus sp. NEAU-3TGS]MDI2588256.1 pilus assembly PilX N-terminal domain-containing protein [Psychrobacillus sp. NEAU-3TGS]
MKFKSFKKAWNLDSNGFTLLGVLMILVLFSVLGVSILAVANNSLKLSGNERTDQSTFYIAEAGIVVTRKDMEDKLQLAYDYAYFKTREDYKKAEDEYYKRPLKEQTGFKFDFATTLEKYYIAKVKTDLPKSRIVKSDSIDFKDRFIFEENYDEGDVRTDQIATVTITREKETSDALEYKLTSVGSIGNKERTVKQKLIVNLKVGNLGDPGTPEIPGTPGTPGHGGGLVEGLPENTAIMVKNEVMIKSSTVTGNIATLKPGAKSITIDWGVPAINGSFFVPSGSEATALTKPASMGFSPQVNGAKMGSLPDLPPFPSIPSYKLSSNYISPEDGSSSLKVQNNTLMGTLKVSGSHILTIDIGDSDREIVLDNLEISGSAQVIVRGTGKLTMYVKNKFYVTGSGKFNVQSSNKNTEIFYSGSEVLGKNFGGGAEIYASLYAQKANVEIASSTRIYGNILSGGTSFIVRGEGKVGPSLYFAPNAHFEVRNSGKVTGTIIGNSISMEGEGLIHFGEPQYNTWVPGTPGTPSTPGTPPTKAPNPDLTKREPLIEI